MGSLSSVHEYKVTRKLFLIVLFSTSICSRSLNNFWHFQIWIQLHFVLPVPTNKIFLLSINLIRSVKLPGCWTKFAHISVNLIHIQCLACMFANCQLMGARPLTHSCKLKSSIQFSRDTMIVKRNETYGETTTCWAVGQLNNPQCHGFYVLFSCLSQSLKLCNWFSVPKQ